jgi:hypothetical protein
MSQGLPAPRAKAPLVDSPWFWVLLFCAGGVVFLLAMGPKYAQRQRRLELQYHARQEMLRRQAEGRFEAREPGQEGDAAPPVPGELIIPIWPLAILFSIGALGAAWMLARSRRGLSDVQRDDREGLT